MFAACRYISVTFVTFVTFVTPRGTHYGRADGPYIPQRPHRPRPSKSAPVPSPSDVDCDVAIIGAGPAGSATAAFLLMADPTVHVTLADKAEFPRDKACGDALGPLAIRELKELGIQEAASLEPIRQAQVSGPDGMSFVAHMPRSQYSLSHGAVMRRYDLDNAIREKAVGQGAQFLPQARLTQMSDSASDATATLETPNGPLRIRAKVLIGADGAKSRVRRFSNIPSEPPVRTGIAIRAYADLPDCFPSDRILLSFDDRLRPGYGWVFPLGDGTANIGVGTVISDLRDQSTDLTDALLRFAHSALPTADIGPISKERTWILPHGGRMPRLTGRRTALIGDAASMINPLSGEGIAYGLRAARHLSDALCLAMSGKKDMTVALKLYSMTVRKEIERHFKDNYRAHRLLRSDRWARAVFGAARDSECVRDQAVSLMFGTGRLASRPVLQILKKAMAP